MWQPTHSPSSYGTSQEAATREASEEQLINALNEYTKALQDGLKIVNHAT